MYLHKIKTKSIAFSAFAVSSTQNFKFGKFSLPILPPPPSGLLQEIPRFLCVFCPKCSARWSGGSQEWSTIPPMLLFHYYPLNIDPALLGSEFLGKIATGHRRGPRKLWFLCNLQVSWKSATFKRRNKRCDSVRRKITLRRRCPVSRACILCPWGCHKEMEPVTLIWASVAPWARK